MHFLSIIPVIPSGNRVLLSLGILRILFTLQLKHRSSPWIVISCLSFSTTLKCAFLAGKSQSLTSWYVQCQTQSRYWKSSDNWRELYGWRLSEHYWCGDPISKIHDLEWRTIRYRASCHFPKVSLMPWLVGRFWPQFIETSFSYGLPCKSAPSSLLSLTSCPLWGSSNSLSALECC